MSGILKIKRDVTTPGSLNDGEFYLNKGLNTVQIGSGSSILTLVPLNQIVSGDIILNGNIYADNLNISSSYALTSSYALFAQTTGNVLSSSFASTSSLAQTASFILSSNVFGPYGFNSIITASHAVTASYAPNYLLNNTTSSMLAPYLLIASTGSMLSGYVQNTYTSSFVTNDETSSFITANQTASFLLSSQTSSMLQPYVLNTNTSSFITNNQTASFLFSSQTSSMLQPYVLNSQTSSFVTNSQTSSFVTNSQTSSFILSAQTSSMVVLLSNTASYVSSSNVVGPNGSNTILSASYALTASLAIGIVGGISAVSSSYPFNVTGSTIFSFNSNRFGVSSFNVPTSQNFLVGKSAGVGSDLSSSIVIGELAVLSTTGDSIISLGKNSGQYSNSLTSSVFIGTNAGGQVKASHATFIGNFAGNQAEIAENSNFIGNFAGRSAKSASYSNLIGYNAGYNLVSAENGIGPNNIIIGTNITLEQNRRDSINIGGILFGTGSYFNTGIIPYSGSTNGRIGINVINPSYNLHASGTISFPSLTQSSSAYIVMYDNNTGQLFYTASSALSVSGSGGTSGTGSGFPFAGNAVITGSLLVSGSGLIVTGSIAASDGITGSLFGTASFYNEKDPVFTSLSASLATTGSNTFIGSQTISASLSITQNLTVLGTASFQTLITVFETASIIYSSGSNIFGDATDDIQTLIGTTRISGSLQVTGSTALGGTLDIGNVSYENNVPKILGLNSSNRVIHMSGADVTVFPYTGSAIISGSGITGPALNVIGTLSLTGSIVTSGSVNIRGGFNTVGITGSVHIGQGASDSLTITDNFGNSSLLQAAGLTIEGPSGGPRSSRFIMHENTTFSNGARIEFVRSRANNVLIGEPDVGEIRYWGAYGNRFFVQGAYIKGTIVSGSRINSAPMKLSFGTSPSGSIIPVQRMVIQENGNVGIGPATASATLHISGANIIFDIPSKQNGYVLQSDANGNATWVNSTTLPTAVPSSIAFNNVTASVSDNRLSYFQLISGSQTLFRITDTGSLVLPSYPVTGVPNYAFVSSGSTTTGLKFVNHTLWVFQVNGADEVKISDTSLEVTNRRINMGAQANQPYIEAVSDLSAFNNLTLNAGSLTKSGSIQLLNGNVLITQTHFPSGSNYRLEISGSGVSGSFNANNVLLVSSSVITLNIPSKANGYVLQSDSSGNATWINPGLLNTAIQSYIGIGNVTASVSTGTGSFQITSGSSTFMFVSSSGNVGIGTTTPTAKLEIDYGTGAGPAISIIGGAGVSENIALKIWDKGTNALNRNVIEFGHLNSAAAYGKGARIVSTNPNDLLSGGAKLILETTRDASNNWNDNQLVLSNSGSVGIGTQSPYYKLEISGSGVSGSFNADNVLLVSSSVITLNIPSKANGYVLQSDANGSATWVNPTTLPAAVSSFIATGSITASVNSGIGSFNMFTIASGSTNGLTYTNEGVLTLTNVSGSSQFPTIQTSGGTSFVIKTAGVLRLSVTSNNGLLLNTNNLDRWRVTNIGDFEPISNNAYDVGTTSARVRNVFAAGTGSFEQGLILTGSFILTGSTLQFDIPSKQSGYILQSDSFGNATWVNSNVFGFATTGSNSFNGNQTITGSLLVSGSGGMNVTGSLGINGSLTENIVTGSLGVGTTTIFQRDTGSFTAALGKYTINNSTNARAGEFMTVWNGNQIVSTDISTTDIGSTTDLVFTASVVSGQIQTSAVAATSGWNVKMLITYL